MINISQHSIKFLNAYACLLICVVLIIAQTMQYFLNELPCPLCLFQRVGFIGIAAGFLLNCYDRPKQLYYFVSVLSALLTFSVGLRQVLLHIVPNTGVYGSTFLGLHLYTWSVILSSMMLLLMTGLILISPQQFNEAKANKTKARKPYLFFQGLFVLLVLLILSNTVITFGICGLGVCPSDPTHYLWNT